VWPEGNFRPYSDHFLSVIMSNIQALNVLHIIGDLDDGGVQKILADLCVGDKANRHTVVSFRDNGKYGSLLSKNGIRVECLQMPVGRISIKGIWTLLLMIRSICPTTIQTWMYHGSLIGSVVARIVSSAPIFWSIHNCNLSDGTVKRATQWVSRILRYLSFFMPKAIIYCAHRALEYHVSLGYNKANSYVVQNGYNFDSFKPDNLARVQFRSNLAIPVDVPLLGMVARFDPQKDHENLFKAISILKQKEVRFSFVLVGTGMTLETSEIAAFVDNYKIKDHLILLGQRNDISSVMNAIDIHVLSSLAEAFPNVLVESMACGTPCVSTDVGDATLIVGDTGWIVNPQSPQELADGILAALNCFADRDEWYLRKLRARQRVVDRFGIDKLIYQHNAVWRI
jgi:glycosyltransferase involved in cell wall biosynthesis